jgi:hypothetical protein
MIKTRACYNCLHYQQVPIDQIHDETVTYRGFSPRCTKGLNPALMDAPDNMQYRREGKFEPDEMASFCDAYLWAPRQYARLRKSAANGLKRDARYTTAQLAASFAQYFEQRNIRIKIERPGGVTEYGRVSISTGWSPVFLLMKSVRTNSSSVVLDDDDRVVGIRDQREKRYRKVLP